MLKKTGAGNLFMVFGEPDIEIAKQKDGRIVVEIKGVDVFDPTTGAIRSHSTDDIACWFIDSVSAAFCQVARITAWAGSGRAGWIAKPGRGMIEQFLE
jgi:hypothetical protein